MHVYLQYANNKKNTNIVVHYIGLANYGKAGWASVAMPILPSANKAKFQTTFGSSFFLFVALRLGILGKIGKIGKNETNETNETNGINGKFPSSEALPIKL